MYIMPLRLLCYLRYVGWFCSVCCVSIEAEACSLRAAIAVTHGECFCEFGSVLIWDVGHVCC
jgi:hypothetical protein